MSRSSRHLPGLVLLGALGFVFAPTAEAGQLFVDSTSGSDANPGTAALPFKTLHKAVITNPATTDAIFVSPGVYSAATGELYPLSVGSVQIFGVGGAAVTTIVGAGNDILFDAHSTGAPGGTFLTLKGLTLAGGRTGLRVSSTTSNYGVVLQDVSITGMSQDGIEAQAIPAGPGAAQASLFLTLVSISGCLRGLSFASASPTEMSILSMNLCRFQGNTVGVDILANGTGDILAATTMSRFEDNALIGLRGFANGGTVDLSATSSLFARNGMGVEAGGLNAGLELRLQSCTLVDNTVAGLATGSLPVPPVSTLLESSILWGNEDDALLAGPVTARWNDIGDGDFAGSDGNIAADPLFRDAAAGDYRLSWGSPAIETGGEIFSMDINGNIRPSDGGLDIASETDMGAIEFMSLELVLPAPTGVIPELPLGGTLRLEAWGEPGATATLFVAPGGIACPLSTAFGLFLLNPFQFVQLVTLPASPTVPGTFEAVLPASPALEGFFLSFQALTTSGVAPKGRALSSGMQLVITP